MITKDFFRKNFSEKNHEARGPLAVLLKVFNEIPQKFFHKLEAKFFSLTRGMQFYFVSDPFKFACIAINPVTFRYFLYILKKKVFDCYHFTPGGPALEFLGRLLKKLQRYEFIMIQFASSETTNFTCCFCSIL